MVATVADEVKELATVLLLVVGSDPQGRRRGDYFYCREVGSGAEPLLQNVYLEDLLEVLKPGRTSRACWRRCISGPYLIVTLDASQSGVRPAVRGCLRLWTASLSRCPAAVHVGLLGCYHAISNTCQRNKPP